MARTCLPAGRLADFQDCVFAINLLLKYFGNGFVAKVTAMRSQFVIDSEFASRETGILSDVVNRLRRTISELLLFYIVNTTGNGGNSLRRTVAFLFREHYEQRGGSFLARN